MKQSSKNQAVTLLEVMVALSLLGIVIVGVSRFYASMTIGKKQTQRRNTMIRLARSIESKLTAPSALYLSSLDLMNNLRYTRCLIGASQGCTKNETEPRDVKATNRFALSFGTAFDKFKRISSGRNTAQRALYTGKGKICTTAQVTSNDPACVFEVKTYFYASCPEDANPQKECPRYTSSQCCLGTSQIHVSYQVEQIRPFKMRADKRNQSKNVNIGRFPPIPKELEWITVAGEDILATESNMNCNGGAIVTGFLPNGRPICKCMRPYRQYQDESNRFGPVCTLIQEEEFSCTEDQLLVGFNKDGSTSCQDAEDAYECKPKSSRNTAYCPGHQAWLRKANLFRNCTFYCTINSSLGGTCCENPRVCDENSPPSDNMIKAHEYGDDKKNPALTNQDDPKKNKQGVECSGGYIAECCSPKTIK